MKDRVTTFILSRYTIHVLPFLIMLIISVFLGASSATAQVRIDNKKLQTSPTSKVQVKGKPKRSKKRRGDRKIGRKEKVYPRETKREIGVYEKPGIRTSGKKGERAVLGGGAPKTTSPSQKVETILIHPGTRSKRAVKDIQIIPRSTGRSNVVPDIKIAPRTTQRAKNAKILSNPPRTTQRSRIVKDIQIIPRSIHRSNVIKDLKIIPRGTQRSRVVKDIQIVPRGTQRSRVVKDIKIIPRSIHRSRTVKDIAVIPRSTHPSGIIKDVKIVPRSIHRSGVVKDVRIIPRSVHRSGLVKDIKIIPRSTHPSEKVEVLKYKHPGTKRNTIVKDVKIIPRSDTGDRGIQDPLPQKYGPTIGSNYTGDRKPTIIYYDSRVPNYKGDHKVKKIKQDKDLSNYQGVLNVAKLTIFNESYINYRGDNKFYSKKRKAAFYQKITRQIYNFKSDNKLNRKSKTPKGGKYVEPEKPLAAESGEVLEPENKQKLAKRNSPSKAHPTARFDSNEKKSIITKPQNKVKSWWFKIFKKKLQPEHLKNREKKPDHDPDEKDIWNY